ncbi:MAG: class I SAM-dependent methyltransferase [Candidatus Magasanikbacteria bacterium]
MIMIKRFFESAYRLWAMCIEALVRKSAFARAEFFIGKMRRWLPDNSRVLDIGCGSGHIGAALSMRGFHVAMVDVGPPWGYIGQWLFGKPCAYALSERVGVAYDPEFCGCGLDVKTSTLDVVLLAFVLHHTENPVQLLSEAVRAVRTGGRIVVFEDIPHTRWQAFWGRVSDVLINLEFGGPHNNETDDRWQDIFYMMHLEVVYTESWVSKLGPLRFPNTMYILEKTEN